MSYFTLEGEKYIYFDTELISQELYQKICQLLYKDIEEILISTFKEDIKIMEILINTKNKYLFYAIRNRLGIGLNMNECLEYNPMIYGNNMVGEILMKLRDLKK